MEEPSIRPGEAADAERLSALATQVWLHTYATDGISSVIAQYVQQELTPETFRRLLSQSRFVVRVAESNRCLVGYAVVDLESPSPSPPAAVELATLYVQEHFARRGIGGALIAACRREAGPTLWLSVNARNEPAKAFYAALGFVRRGVSYFELGGETHENHVLVG